MEDTKYKTNKEQKENVWLQESTGLMNNALLILCDGVFPSFRVQILIQWSQNED